MPEVLAFGAIIDPDIEVIIDHHLFLWARVEQLKCVRCNKLFATVRARAARETGCRFCRWCDRMFRSAANRARHERLCLDRPDADVVAE